MPEEIAGPVPVKSRYSAIRVFVKARLPEPETVSLLEVLVPDKSKVPVIACVPLIVSVSPPRSETVKSPKVLLPLMLVVPLQVKLSKEKAFPESG